MNLKKRFSLDSLIPINEFSSLTSEDTLKEFRLKQPIYRFRFGKYVGLTVDEVYKRDTGYLRWLLGLPGFRSKHVIISELKRMYRDMKLKNILY